MRWAAVFFLVLAGCTKVPPDTHDADIKAVKDNEAAWMKTAAAKNLDAFMAYYADDASVLMPNAPLFTGKAAIKEELKPIMEDPNYSITSTPTRVEVSQNLAFTQGTYKMTFSDIRGNKFEDEGKYLTIYRKQADGTWKAIEDTMMSDLPLPPPPPQ